MIQLQTRRIISLSAWTLTLTAYCTTAQTIRPSREIATLEQSNIASVAQAVESMLRNGQLVSHRIQHAGQMPERTHERLDQYHKGLYVFGGQLIWQKKNGLVLSVAGQLYDNVRLNNHAPALRPEQITQHLLSSVGAGATIVGTQELLILPLKNRFALAYRTFVRGQNTLDVIFVDAHSGKTLLRYNGLWAQTATVGLAIGTWNDRKKMTVEVAGGTHRAVDRMRPFLIKTYDVQFDFKSWNAYEAATDSFLATDLDNEWRDGAVVDAHTFAGYTYDYYFKRHGRSGIDDQGMTAINYVHILPKRREINNAFYDSFDHSLNYFDGDGKTFNVFSSSLEVVAHELTHAITNFTSNLIYLNESGALNEAISDIMGASVEWFFEPPGHGRQYADWMLGEDLFMKFGPAIRTFVNPLSFNYPDHYSVRCTTECPETFDNGGVHINSSIINHAFYLMVMGGTNTTSGKTVNGIGLTNMDHIESIFYRAFMFHLTPNSNFGTARRATLRAARELYGTGSLEEQVVRAGWNAVGIK